MINHKVPYQYNGNDYEGMLVFDDTVTEKRPAVFMQPDWLGVCSHTEEMAAQAAEKDYVIMMADMFGKNYGGMKKSNDELGAIARAKRANIEFILGCGNAADAALTREADRLGLIKTGKKGAIGYCMGGGFILEQLRSGSNFDGTVVFHVTLPTTVAPDRRNEISGRVLLIHGSNDIVTPKAQIEALETEMSMNKVDWQVMMFGHAEHSFCVPNVNDELQRYDETLCRQSYRLMRDFFNETL